ncbi:MAG: cupin domain-containing protein [Chlorobiaceae bacterium]
MKSTRCIILVILTFLLPAKAEADDYRNLEVKKLLTSSSASNGQPLAYLQTEHPEVTVLAVTIPPGGETGWHKHPVPVYAYVLDGLLTVEMKGAESYQFKKGEAVLEVMNTLHNGRNLGAGNVSLVVFYTGATGVPNVVKESPSNRLP